MHVIFMSFMFVVIHVLRPLSVCAVLDPKCLNSKCACCLEDFCGQSPWFYNECFKGCIDGHRGARCYELCEHNCKSCYENISVCDSCYDGYFPGPESDCTAKCPDKCKTCIGQTYCTSCKEGFYGLGSLKCSNKYCPRNCYCKDKNCVSCKNGFYDIHNSCKQRCPPGCAACYSQDNCTDCRNGFYSGYELDDIQGLHFNNCSFTCRESCISCTSYNECKTCVSGKYGLKCQNECAIGCLDNLCLFESGYCNCSSNFTGKDCSRCIQGRFGLYCNETCCRNRTIEGQIENCPNECNITYSSTKEESVGLKCDYRTIIIVMATVAGLSVFVNIGLAALMVLRKRVPFSRGMKDHEEALAYENPVSTKTEKRSSFNRNEGSDAFYPEANDSSYDSVQNIQDRAANVGISRDSKYDYVQKINGSGSIGGEKRNGDYANTQNTEGSGAIGGEKRNGDYENMQNTEVAVTSPQEQNGGYFAMTGKALELNGSYVEMKRKTSDVDGEYQTTSETTIDTSPICRT